VQKFVIGLNSGILGGFFGGLLGLGGGVIMIPLMTWLAKMTHIRLTEQVLLISLYCHCWSDDI
jgi:uncharacterized membrane protein YfcA